ncbi:hypothetical protein V8C44DRAFT_315208 [Trichoderma aethiopicum]
MCGLGTSTYLLLTQVLVSRNTEGHQRQAENPSRPKTWRKMRGDSVGIADLASSLNVCTSPWSYSEVDRRRQRDDAWIPLCLLKPGLKAPRDCVPTEVGEAAVRSACRSMQAHVLHTLPTLRTESRVHSMYSYEYLCRHMHHRNHDFSLPRDSCSFFHGDRDKTSSRHNSRFLTAVGWSRNRRYVPRLWPLPAGPLARVLVGRV